MSYAESEIISLKGHPEFTELWLHSRIAEKPEILGLGEVVLRDRERIQPKAGRLDLLLEDVDLRRRYEVEVQLGSADESHIIRTIEYWDNEKKRFPQYDHCAVIIAENITGRFLNVISLFNGHIPLIAIQVKAIKIENKVTLFFTKVLDEVKFGFEEEPAANQQETNRAYWEERATPETVRLADTILEYISPFAPGFELKYNKYYIGLAQNGRAQNFVAFKPQRKAIRIDVGMVIPAEIKAKLEEADIEVMDYVPQWRVTPIKLSIPQVKDKKDVLVEVIKRAFEEYYS
ncbi:hypothetical protein K2X30_10185 [bacterium]|nr:hypothetical protein [bacterium]